MCYLLSMFNYCHQIKTQKTIKVTYHITQGKYKKFQLLKGNAIIYSSCLCTSLHHLFNKGQTQEGHATYWFQCFSTWKKDPTYYLEWFCPWKPKKSGPTTIWCNLVNCFKAKKINVKINDVFTNVTSHFIWQIHFCGSQWLEEWVQWMINLVNREEMWFEWKVYN
jgi:hypothetical protein